MIKACVLVKKVLGNKAGTYFELGAVLACDQERLVQR
jgi:hypothetical protein